MSDLLTDAAAKTGVPEPLMRRSAEARAAANGMSVDEVLSAWAGGEAAAPAPSPPAQTHAEGPGKEPTEETAPTPGAPESAPPPEPSPAPEALPTVTAVALLPGPESAASLQPIPLSTRVRTAIRVGAWSGAALGLVGFVVASTWAAPTTTVIGEGPYTPVLQVDSNGVVVGAALLSVVFGAVIASLSRAAASWVDPGMELSNSPSSTAWLGGLIGLVLGVVGGAVLTGGFGIPVEGVEGAVQLPVLATIAVMAFGSALLGGLTAAATQAVGVPVAVPEEEGEEVATVRRRLGIALGVPLTALTMLVLLVLPFAYALIRSNEVTAGGAAVVGILTASGILAFAALAGTKPNVRISFGEAMVAVIGIGVVLVLILAVIFARGGGEESTEPAAVTSAAARVS